MSERSRFLVVVSRRDPAIFDHLTRALAGTAGVVVVLDRRQGERRRGGAHTDDRRRGDRRVHPAPEFPALGSDVVRVGGERAGEGVPPAPVTDPCVSADEAPHAYRTLLWPTVRLADLFPARRGRER